MTGQELWVNNLSNILIISKSNDIVRSNFGGVLCYALCFLFCSVSFFIKTKYSLKMPFVLFKYFSVIMTV